MSIKTIITEPVFEKTTRELRAVLQKPDGTGFKPDAITFTLYDVKTNAIINSRLDVDVLARVSDGTLVVDGDTLAAGTLSLMLTPDDNQILNVARAKRKGGEVHRALLEWSWDSPARFDKYEVEFTVQDNPQVS